MIEFLNRLFGRQSSGAVAKERLRLVLMSDHLSLAPEMVEAMKRDFIDVISRYVEVDRDKIDVHFEHQASALAMLANIPIVAVNRNGGNKPVELPLQAAAPATQTSETQAQAPAKPAPKRKRRRKAAPPNGKTQGDRPQGATPAPAT